MHLSDAYCALSPIARLNFTEKHSQTLRVLGEFDNLYPACRELGLDYGDLLSDSPISCPATQDILHIDVELEETVSLPIPVKYLGHEIRRELKKLGQPFSLLPRLGGWEAETAYTPLLAELEGYRGYHDGRARFSPVRWIDWEFECGTFDGYNKLVGATDYGLIIRNRTSLKLVPTSDIFGDQYKNLLKKAL